MNELHLQHFLIVFFSDVFSLKFFLWNRDSESYWGAQTGLTCAVLLPLCGDYRRLPLGPACLSPTLSTSATGALRGRWTELKTAAIDWDLSNSLVCLFQIKIQQWCSLVAFHISADVRSKSLMLLLHHFISGKRCGLSILLGRKTLPSSPMATPAFSHLSTYVMHSAVTPSLLRASEPPSAPDEMCGETSCMPNKTHLYKRTPNSAGIWGQTGQVQIQVLWCQAGCTSFWASVAPPMRQEYLV